MRKSTIIRTDTHMSGEGIAPAHHVEWSDRESPVKSQVKIKFYPENKANRLEIEIDLTLTSVTELDKLIELLHQVRQEMYNTDCSPNVPSGLNTF